MREFRSTPAVTTLRRAAPGDLPRTLRLTQSSSNLRGEKCDLPCVVFLEVEETVTFDAASGHAADFRHLDQRVLTGGCPWWPKKLCPGDRKRWRIVILFVRISMISCFSHVRGFSGSVYVAMVAMLILQGMDVFLGRLCRHAPSFSMMRCSAPCTSLAMREASPQT